VLYIIQLAHVDTLPLKKVTCLKVEQVLAGVLVINVSMQNSKAAHNIK